METQTAVRAAALMLVLGVGCTKAGPSPEPAPNVESLFPADPVVLAHFQAYASAVRRLEADLQADPALDARLEAQLEAALTTEDADILLRLADSLANPGVVSGTSAWTPPADLPVLLGHLRALPYFEESLAGAIQAGTPAGRAAAERRSAQALVQWPLTNCTASCEDYATGVYWSAVVEQTVGLAALIKFKDLNVVVKCGADAAKCGLQGAACDKQVAAAKTWGCMATEAAKAAGYAIGSTLYSWLFKTIDAVYLVAEAQAAARDGMLACLSFQSGDTCCTAANDKALCGAGATPVCLTTTALNVSVNHCGGCDTACTSPPPPFCDSATSRVTSTNQARCVLGACAYHQDRKSCDAPPAAYCVNGTELVTYAVPGDCHAATAECRYTQQVEHCNAEGLACVASAMGATCGTACTGPSDCTGGRECQAGVCACPAGQEACSGTCISTSACCTDQDCAEGTACTSGVCCRPGMKACDGGCLATSLCCTNADCGAGGTCQADGSCQRASHWAGRYRASNWTRSPVDNVGGWLWEMPGRVQGPHYVADIGYFYFSDDASEVVLGTNSDGGTADFDVLRRALPLGWKSTDETFAYTIPTAFAQSTGSEVITATGSRTATFKVLARSLTSLSGTFEVTTRSGYIAALGLASSSWRTVPTTTQGTWSATRIDGPGPQTRMNGFDTCVLGNGWYQTDMALVTHGCNPAFMPGYCSNMPGGTCVFQ